MRDLAKARRRGASRLANGWRAGVDMVTAAITEIQRLIQIRVVFILYGVAVKLS